MKAALFLFLLVSVAFAGYCKDRTYSGDLTVKLPLYDVNADGVLVEVSQRFDLNTSSYGDLTIAINCVSFGLSGYDRYNCDRGSIVVRALDSFHDEPGVILHQIDSAYTGICPHSGDFYSYTESFRVTIPSKFKKTIFIGYQTLATKAQHDVLFASDKDVEPVAKNYLWTNHTDSWEDNSRFYGHLGIDADIVIP